MTPAVRVGAGVAGVAVTPVPGHTVGQRTVAWPRAHENPPGEAAQPLPGLGPLTVI